MLQQPLKNQPLEKQTKKCKQTTIFFNIAVLNSARTGNILQRDYDKTFLSESGSSRKPSFPTNIALLNPLNSASDLLNERIMC